MKGQEDSARKMITEAILNGHWLMLQVQILSLSKSALEQNCQNMHQNKIFKMWIRKKLSKCASNQKMFFPSNRTVTSVLTSAKKSSPQLLTLRTCTATSGEFAWRIIKLYYISLNLK